VVAVSDSQGTLTHSPGIDVSALIRHKDSGHPVATMAGGESAARDAIIDVDCDIWIPAAGPDVISEDNAARLRTKLILQGANIPLTAGAERMLHARNVLVLPDFLVNAGGVICAALEYRGATQTAAFDAIAERIRANTAAVLEQLHTNTGTPREAAHRLAISQVRRDADARCSITENRSMVVGKRMQLETRNLSQESAGRMVARVPVALAEIRPANALYAARRTPIVSISSACWIETVA
jgi:glutamate dehydrogenase/leucine dehydrogenase